MAAKAGFILVKEALLVAFAKANVAGLLLLDVSCFAVMVENPLLHMLFLVGCCITVVVEAMDALVNTKAG